MSEHANISGQCLCAAIRFTAQTDGPHLGACHCSMCRKWGSSPFMEVECGFCSRCGSNFFHRIKESGSAGVAAGLIDHKSSYFNFADKTREPTCAEVFALLEASRPNDN